MCGEDQAEGLLLLLRRESAGGRGNALRRDGVGHISHSFRETPAQCHGECAPQAAGRAEPDSYSGRPVAFSLRAQPRRSMISAALAWSTSAYTSVTSGERWPSTALAASRP